MIFWQHSGWDPLGFQQPSLQSHTTSDPLNHKVCTATNTLDPLNCNVCTATNTCAVRVQTNTSDPLNCKVRTETNTLDPLNCKVCTATNTSDPLNCKVCPSNPSNKRQSRECKLPPVTSTCWCARLCLLIQVLKAPVEWTGCWWAWCGLHPLHSSASSGQSCPPLHLRHHRHLWPPGRAQELGRAVTGCRNRGARDLCEFDLHPCPCCLDRPSPWCSPLWRVCWTGAGKHSGGVLGAAFLACVLVQRQTSLRRPHPGAPRCWVANCWRSLGWRRQQHLRSECCCWTLRWLQSRPTWMSPESLWRWRCSPAATRQRHLPLCEPVSAQRNLFQSLTFCWPVWHHSLCLRKRDLLWHTTEMANWVG